LVIASGWAVFALMAVSNMIFKLHGNYSQQYFITLCSVSVMQAVYSVERLSENDDLEAAIDEE